MSWGAYWWLYVRAYWHALHLRRASDFWPSVIELAAWTIALAWVMRCSDLVRFMPDIPVLTGVDWDDEPEGMPRLTVIVPARNEAENIAATLDALLQADYGALQIVAVDDRSNDGTGAIMQEYAAKALESGAPEKLQVIRIEELPDGWLGKTFAMSVATERSDSEYILYTDADVLFSPSVLRRAVVFAESTQADHVVVLPTMQVKSWGEGMVLGFFQILGLWASRPWKIDDPHARRDVIGVGAFNMVRRTALEELGGWGPQRLVVIEDIALGRRMKAAGMRQRVAFAPGLVLVHWAKGARGLVRVMTKNMFSAFNFRPLLLLGAVAWMVVFCLLPLAGLAWGRTVVPAVLVLCSIGAAYRVMETASWIDARYGFLYPLGALAFVVALLRSMVVVVWQRGVVWRGTHYSLRELRRHNSPFVWERAARRERDERRLAVRAAERREKKMRARG